LEISIPITGGYEVINTPVRTKNNRNLFIIQYLRVDFKARRLETPSNQRDKDAGMLGGIKGRVGCYIGALF
jgi:hypothetical protein